MEKEEYVWEFPFFLEPLRWNKLYKFGFLTGIFGFCLQMGNAQEFKR